MIKTHIINSTTAEYTDAELSWLQDAVLSAGYFATQVGDRTSAVVQKTTPSMGVDIQSGKILAPFTKSGISWKVICDTTGESLIVSPNTSGVNRVDAVIFKLDTTLDPNALKSNIATAQIVQGTGATPLTDGAIQTAIGATYTFIRLANITVASGATNILDTAIDNVIQKVKITPAVDVDAGSIVYENSTVSGDFVSELSAQNITNVLQPISATKLVDYKTDETLPGNSLGETVQTLTGGNVLPSERANTRSGIYTLFGFDWIFFLVNGVIHYSRKVAGTTGSWSARVSTGIAVMDQTNRNWTMGCDEETGRFFFAYVKNMGVTDGKMYHRMAQADVAGLTVSSEVVAWQDVTWKVKTNQNSYAQSMDSEFINGKYFVVFQATTGSNYKAIVIGTSTIDGNWTMLPSCPHDIDSDFADTRHGIGASIGGLGNGNAGVICFRRATGSPYPNNFLIYKNIDTETVSFGSIEVVANLGQNNPSYDYDMTRHTSVSYLNKTPFIMIQKSSSGSYGEDTPREFKKQLSGNWIELDVFTNLGISPTSFAYTGVFFSSGNRLYNTIQASDGGGSQLFNCPFMQYGSNGFNCNYNDTIPPNAFYFTTSLFPGRYPSSNGFGVVSWTRGVQNGKGCQNAFGFIHQQNGTTTLKVGYYKTYFVDTTISVTDFTNANSRRQFIGFNKSAIAVGTYGQVQVSGLIEGFSNLIPGRKCYVSSIGITQYQTVNSIYVGIAKSSTSIELDIEQLYSDEQPSNSSAQYVTLPQLPALTFDYDGELVFTPTGTNTQVGYKQVREGETIATNANPFSAPGYRRLQK